MDNQNDSIAIRFLTYALLEAVTFIIIIGLVFNVYDVVNKLHLTNNLRYVIITAAVIINIFSIKELINAAKKIDQKKQI